MTRARYGEGALIVCDNLVRIFKVADLEVVALQGLDLLVEAGEMVAIVGASGSGKSTLLNILGGLDTPSAGRAGVDGHDLGQMGRRERTAYRRRVVGVVWQQTARNLLPYLTAVENVELPMILDGRATDGRGRGSCSSSSAWPGAPTIVRSACRAASSSASRSPLRWPTIRRSCSRTSRPASSTARRRPRSSACCGGSTPIRRDDRRRHPRHARLRARRADGLDPRRSDEHGDVPPDGAGDDGDHRVIAEEFAVLDRVGRLQPPRAHVDALELSTGSAFASRTTTSASGLTSRPTTRRTR